MKPNVHWKCVHSFEHTNFQVDNSSDSSKSTTTKVPITMRMMYHEKENKFVVLYSSSKGISVLEMKQKSVIGGGKQFVCEYDTRLMNSGFGCSVAMDNETNSLWMFGGYFFDEGSDEHGVTHRCHLGLQEHFIPNQASALSSASSNLKKTTKKATKRLTRVLSSSSSPFISITPSSERSPTSTTPLPHFLEAPKKTSHLFSYSLERHWFSDYGSYTNEDDSIEYLNTNMVPQMKHTRVSPRMSLSASTENIFWPKVHAYHQAIIQNGRMYVFGGPSEDKSNQKQQLENQSNAEELNEKALIKLGLASDLYSSNSFVYIYDFKTKSWLQPRRTSFRSEKTLKADQEKAKNKLLHNSSNSSDNAIVTSSKKKPSENSGDGNSSFGKLFSFTALRPSKSSPDLRTEFMYEEFMPKNRIGHSVIVSGDKCFIYGGRTFRNQYDEYACCDPSVYCYNMLDDSWACLGSGSGDVPAARMNHGFTTLPKRSQAFIIAGGHRVGAADMASSFTATQRSSSDFEIEDATQIDTDSEGEGEADDYEIDGGGGFNLQIVDHYSDIFIYNISLNTWSEVSQSGHCPLQSNTKQDIAMCNDGKDLYLLLHNRADSSLDLYRGVITYA